MNKKEFRQKLKQINFTITKFSTLCGIGYSTAKDWEDVPKWVPLVLNYIEITQKIDFKHEEIGTLSNQISALEKIKCIIAEI